MGFHCTWTDPTPQASLISFGVFTRDWIIPLEYVVEDIEVDFYNYLWSSSSPTHKPSMQKVDPIYGLIKTPCQMRVAWQDCTKPIQTVRVNFCHNTSNSLLP